MTIVPSAELEFADLPGRRSADPLRGQAARSSMRIVEMTRTDGRTAHRHPHSEEVVYVEMGHGEVWIDGVSHPVAPGDVVLIPAGAAHATVPAEHESMRLVCFFPHADLRHNLQDTDIEVT